MTQGAPGERLLERGDELETLSDALRDVGATGRGELFLISGGAGIGKTTLVRTFCSGLDQERVFSGACESLYTPRPLGPLVDIAEQTGGEFAELVERGAGPSDLLSRLGHELRRRNPAVVVLEDLHWADEATLDVVRLMGRRIESLPALVIATYRDDELDRTHPLRIALGDMPRIATTRLTLPPLSAAAVANLARPYGADAEVLYARTGGNPFYVTEALAAGGATMPDTVRDAVLARAARLDTGPRDLLDTVAIVPSRAELWLLEALVGEDQLGHLESCLASGMLRTHGDSVSFRHEIARVAIEQALPPDRAMALHRRALAALTSRRHGDDGLARIAHHAEAAGDADAVLRYAPAAGERSAVLGAHRESAAQFARALRFADGLESDRRAHLLERRSYECYLTDSVGEAIEAHRLALAEHRSRGDRLREGDAHRWLSRLNWFAGDNTAAYTEARLAVDLLTPLPPGPELAMAYSNMAQLGMLADDLPEARRWGTRACELASRLGQTEIVVHALNNVGTAELREGVRDGAAKIERSLELALEAELEEHVARAHTNLGATSIEARDYASADHHLEEGITYCHERDLDSWLIYMTGWLARSHLEQGRWDAALECATFVLERRRASAPSRITPLVVLGSLRARRGDPNPWVPLDTAAELASHTGELQRLAPVALARAEARWLGGEFELVENETEHVLEIATAHRSAWVLGELIVWRRRAGIVEPVPARVAEPYWLELQGRHEAAGKRGARVGCPYDSAIALAMSKRDASLRRSLDILQRLGASRSAARVARELRERGARNLRTGPRAATRENPAGLTARELEVFELVCHGMRNGQIAERLILSRKTVDHHVSAILRKVHASTRTEAVAEASRLGLFER